LKKKVLGSIAVRQIITGPFKTKTNNNPPQIRETNIDMSKLNMESHLNGRVVAK
jgi:hypothetical protein